MQQEKQQPLKENNSPVGSTNLLAGHAGERSAARTAAGESRNTEQSQHKHQTPVIPFRIQGLGEEVYGSAHDIHQDGFQVISAAALSPGTPVALQFSFGTVCYLNVSGQVAYCLPTVDGATRKYAAEIRFCALRDFEKKILLSAVHELTQNTIPQDKSLLTILVSNDTLAVEAAHLSQDASRQLDKADPIKRPSGKRNGFVGSSDFIPKHKRIDFTQEGAQARRDWLGLKTSTAFQYINSFAEDPRVMQGNIENLIGVAHVPIGIAGPLKVNGKFANDLYYIPMATTEGAIVYTYTRGMHLASAAGGINVSVLRDEINISPIFVFATAQQAYAFELWLKANFEKIREAAESTTTHGKLIRLEPHILDRRVVVKFCYTTGDAMGLNMINIATEEACKFIVSAVQPEEFFLRSNFSSVKKVSAHNYAVAGFGKTVMADIVIPRDCLKRLFNVKPETMERYCQLSMLSSTHAGMIGMNGHTANGLAAIFIACGQDVANVVDSQASVSFCETTQAGDLYVSLKIPNLVIGTVGGGVTLGTQRECLNILGCYGDGQALKFSEIVAASLLAGEIAVAAAIVSGTFVAAHKKYGRKPRPRLSVMES